MIFSLLKMFILATCVLCMATPISGAEIFLRSGPWILLHEDGSLRIGMELAGAVQSLDVASLHVQRGVQILELAPMVSKPLRRGLQGESYYVSFDLSVSDAKANAGGVLELYGVQEQALHVRIPEIPQADDHAVVVFASSLNYPLRGDLERVAADLGHAVQLVVLLGDDNEKRIGKGGWEADIPIIAINDLSADLSVDQLDIQQAIFGLGSQWRQGVRWGALALPSAPSDMEVLGALNKTVGHWQIFLDPQKRWDLGLLSLKKKSISSLRYLLAVCANKQLPIILAAGSGSSFISEPLAVKTSEFGVVAMKLEFITLKQWQSSVDLMAHGKKTMRQVLLEQAYVSVSEAGRIDHELSKAKSTREIYDKTGGVVQWPGGIRYCSISAAGLGFSHLTDEVALPIYDPSLCAVYADTGSCRIVMSSEFRNVIELQYFKDDPNNISSWGEQDVVSLYEKIIGDDLDQVAAAMRALAWVPSEKIVADLNLTSYKLRELLKICMDNPNGAQLLRRLSTMDKTSVLLWLHDYPKAALNMQRDLMLRCLEVYSYAENSNYLHIIKHQNDYHIIWPLLKLHSKLGIHEKIHLSKIFQSRLELQVAGTVAHDRDPMLQREVMSLIFESPYLSPTALRPLAHAMRKVGHDLAVGAQSPIQRFFDQSGEKRPK